MKIWEKSELELTCVDKVRALLNFLSLKNIFGGRGALSLLLISKGLSEAWPYAKPVISMLGGQEAMQF